MGSAVVYSHRLAGSGGGGVDDILKRLGNVEESVTDLRAQVGAIAATLPHLATAESVAKLRSDLTNEIKGIAATMPGLATAESVSKIEAVIPRLATAESVSKIE